MADSNKKKNNTKKNNAKEKQERSQAVKNTTFSSEPIPARLFMGILCLCMFFIQLVVIFQPQGTLPLAYRSLMLGLFGEVGFWMLLFLLPYLFWVLNLMKRGNAMMRSFSAIRNTYSSAA